MVTEAFDFELAGLEAAWDKLFSEDLTAESAAAFPSLFAVATDSSPEAADFMDGVPSTLSVFCTRAEEAAGLAAVLPESDFFGATLAFAEEDVAFDAAVFALVSGDVGDFTVFFIAFAKVSAVRLI